MMGKTHIIGGAATFAVLTTVNPPSSHEEAIISLLSCIVGSLIPDVDHTQSKINKNDILIGAVSEAVCMFTKHRGVTHTPLGCLFFALLCYYVSRNLFPYANANSAILLALIVFAAIHLGARKKKLKRFGGILAVVAALEITLFPWIPEFTIPEGYELTIGLSVFLGAVSHLLFGFIQPGRSNALIPMEEEVSCRQSKESISRNNRNRVLRGAGRGGDPCLRV